MEATRKLSYIFTSKKLFPIVAGLLLVSCTAIAADVIYVAEQQSSRVRKVQLNGSIGPFANGVGSVYGLTLDDAGNLYLAGTGDDTIRKVTPAGVISNFVSGGALGSAWGLAFDSIGNLYSGSSAFGTISRISPSGNISAFASGMSFPTALAFDADGNLYAANGGNNTISKITPSGVASTFASGFNFPWGLAFDKDGNLFVANYLGNSISKVTSNGVVSLFTSEVDRPTGLAFDSHGNLYVCNITVNNPLGYLSKITPEGVATVFVSGLNYPTAIAIQKPVNRAPVARCADVSVSAGDNCTANASVDDASFDPDGDPITITQLPPGPYAVGINLVTLVVEDNKGVSNSCSAIVTVRDTRPPTIVSATVNPAMLWPPNHEMVRIVVGADVLDCCSTPTWKIIGVQSNEPINGLGDGNPSPDWVITSDHTVLLRAARSGKGNGRIYSISLQAEDASGNISKTSVVRVTVPKNKDKVKVPKNKPSRK